MNPIALLFKSRKFLLLLLDTVISIALYFTGKYLPGAEADIKFVILGLQPVVVALIFAIAWEDTKIVPAQLSLEESKEYNEAYKVERAERAEKAEKANTPPVM